MIEPIDITTVRIGQLGSAPINLTDNIPHESGSDLYRATIQELSDFIESRISTSTGVGFRPVTVTSGQTLPTTTVKEWILVGEGTFYNINGGATITTTEELNALMSDGNYWTLGVQIPISADLIGIVQTIRASFTATAPSENAVFEALALKANIVDVPTFMQMIDYPQLTAPTSDFTLPSGAIAKQVFINKTQWFKETANNLYQVDTWTQTGAVVALKKPAVINNYIVIFYQ